MTLYDTTLPQNDSNQPLIVAESSQNETPPPVPPCNLDLTEVRTHFLSLSSS